MIAQISTGEGFGGLVNYANDIAKKNTDYIEFLYTDEAEHQAEIQRLWENRRKRLEQELKR